MKFSLFVIAVFSISICAAQKFDTNVLKGKWRVSKSTAAPLVFIFSSKRDGEKGLLKNWHNPSDFIYKVSFKYDILPAPKDSLTGNPSIDENLFLMTTTTKTLFGSTDIQSFLVHIATQDSIGFVLHKGFISPFNRVK